VQQTNRTMTHHIACLLLHTDIFAVSLAFSLTYAVAVIAKFVFIMPLSHRAEALIDAFV